jgi:hypothetical protein
MGPLLSILPTVLKTGASVFANRQKAKILMSDAELLHAQKMANGEVEYQAAVRQSNDKGWKDEFVLILVSLPVLSSVRYTDLRERRYSKVKNDLGNYGYVSLP